MRFCYHHKRQLIIPKVTLIMQSPIKFNIRLVLLCCLLLNCLSGYAQEWKLEKHRDGVAVYSRFVANNLLQIKALTTVMGNHDAFLNLLEDVEHCTAWIANCQKIQVIAEPDQYTRVVHSYFNAPWPIKDRDMVTRSTMVKQDDNLTLLIEDVGQQFPTQPKYVRMTHVSGKWQLVELADGNMSVSYIGSGNPAGNIPKWLARKALLDSTFETFSQLKAVISQVKYARTITD